ncbi:MAG TPA: hypothetical protein VGN42_15720 [Pirellulales bacterium]|jgi:type II secretory pathway predicted ATPase ExeA|nr:hypothetical protein [Pirellulales bacterium]
MPEVAQTSASKGPPRGRRERAKQKVVEARRFKDIRLKEEWVAEMKYQPVACRRAASRREDRRVATQVKDASKPNRFPCPDQAY